MAKKMAFSIFISIIGFCLLTQGTSNAAATPAGTLKFAFHIGYSADWGDPSFPSTYSSHFFLYLFHDALLKPMPDGMYSPCLAESWKVSPDSRVYDFFLRKGVKFHNGDELTAEDVVFTFRRYKGISAKTIQDRTEKLEAVTPYQFRITFKTPFPNFFEYLLPGSSTSAWIVPKRYIEKVGDAEYKKHPVGCGPYKFLEFRPDVRIVGEAFENFWRKVPNLKRIEVYFVKETSTRYAMVQRGEMDIASYMTDIYVKNLKKDQNLRPLTSMSATRWIIQMAAQWDLKSPWSDPRVRKAASLALDRKTLADIHFPGSAPIGSFGLPGDPETVDFPPDPYDPEGARKLLAEAGYPKGFAAGTFFPYDGPMWPMGEQIANYWKAVGINVNIQLLDRISWSEKRRVGQMKGGTFNDPSTQPTIGGRLEYLFGGGFGYGNYPDIEALWGQYNRAIDGKARKDLIARIQKLIYEKTMYISYISNAHVMAGGPRVKGNPFRIQPPKSSSIYWPSPFEDIELRQ